jgi:hypothetical protein
MDHLPVEAALYAVGEPARTRTGDILGALESDVGSDIRTVPMVDIDIADLLIRSPPILSFFNSSAFRNASAGAHARCRIW